MDILHIFFERQCDKYPDKTCLICDDTYFSYEDIEFLANQLAHWLLANGIKPEHTVGVLLDRSVDLYISVLAILKAGAAYVPIDQDYPLERVEYIVKYSKVKFLLTSKPHLKLSSLPKDKVIDLQKIKPILEAQSTDRPPINGLTSDNLCYVIYTSGTTGWPKGVAITHRSVCNYVQSAIDIYRVTHKDRVYQGFTIAFDASIEEIWLAFASGGTLVASAARDVREGATLVDFLNFHKVTVLSTVPTMLGMINPNIPSLRTLILGGEACSQELVSRWRSPKIRIFNTYGPSEATIISTYLECKEPKKITIGRPIPNCEVLILDDQQKPVAQGASGELCIGGLGLAREYFNNPELTQEKFIAHPLDPSKRLYRSGDLARITPDGEIEYLGRLDGQIKLRGFRVELEEIENALRQFSQIRDAAVTVHELVPGMQSLVAYLVLEQNTVISVEHIQKSLSTRLPHYMIPFLYEILPALPQIPSGKVDRKGLPKPQLYKTIGNKQYVAPGSEVEKKISAIWENILKLSPISIDSDFFTELGGHSLAAATIVSEIRKHKEMSDVSLADMYENTTIKKLAIKIAGSQLGIEDEIVSPSGIGVKKIIDSIQYFFCAFIQGLFSLILITVSPWHFMLVMLVVISFAMSLSTTGLSVHFILLCLAFLFLLEPALILFSILVKWLLLGKIKPGRHKLWGLYYLRWWIVNQIQDFVSVDLLVGSVFINVYCRLMGAKVGKNCYIGTDLIRAFDLFRIGDNSSLAADVIALGYKVEGGFLEIGSITVGKNCTVAADAVLSINTTLNDGSKLNEHSLLSEGKTLLENENHNGSPSSFGSVDVDSNLKEASLPKNMKKLAMTLYIFCQYCLLMFLKCIYAIAAIPGVALIVYFGYVQGNFMNFLWVIPLSAIMYVALICLEIFTLKKIFGPVKKGRYAIKSFIYLKIWFIDRLTALGLRAMESLYGTIYSSAWFRLLGAKIGKNTELSTVGFSFPDMINIGKESFIADSTMLAPLRVCQGHIYIDAVHLGKRVFIGNGALVPAKTIINDNCLIACSSVPPATSVPCDTSWLGSPSFCLPHRQVHLGDTESKTYNPTLKAKIGRGIVELFRVFLPPIFFYFILTMDVITFIFLASKFSLLLTMLLFPLFSASYVIFATLIIISLKWLLVGRYRESATPMWTPFVWCSELITALFDTFISPFLLEAFLGTPFVALFLRLLGAKIGKRVFINTLYFSEFDLIKIEDDVCLNRDTTIQTHLYEDRIFKMSNIKIEKGCTVGDRSIVLYDTIMKHHSSLGNLSLLMKGEVLYPNSDWEGIPAKRIYRSKFKEQI